MIGVRKWKIRRKQGLIFPGKYVVIRKIETLLQTTYKEVLDS